MAQKEVTDALDKLEKSIYICDISVPELVMIATRNNEKALYNKEITEERYLQYNYDINKHVTYFKRECYCLRERYI